MRLSAGAFDRLGATMAAISSLSALQADLIWDRAFGLGWKEIEVRNPGMPQSTLRWHYDEALHSVRHLVAKKPKTVGNRYASRRTR